MDDERLIEEVYRRRAEQLARPAVSGPASTTFAALVVGLGAERYAIELSALAEVLPYSACTAVPGAPASLAGVMNVRGDIRAVADLRRILELPPADGPAGGYVVMVRHHDRPLGLRVDRLDEVRQIDRARLVPAASARALAGSRFVKALTDETVALIDTDAVVSGLGLTNSNRT